MKRNNAVINNRNNNTPDNRNNNNGFRLSLHFHATLGVRPGITRFTDRVSAALKILAPLRRFR